MTPIGKVRSATGADMRFIKAWLPKDYSVGTLAMNWNVTMKVFAKGKVSVWEDALSGRSVAYCWGSLNSHDSVLEVHPAYRRLGVGRAMAVFMIENSIAEGDPLLEIHISPDSAEPFWQEMGFQTYWDNGRCYGRRIVEMPQQAVVGVRRAVTVKFLPESATWSREPNSEALASHHIEGTEVSDGRIILDRAAAHYDLPDGDDLAIEVLVDGRSRYRGKAKYSEANAIGLKRCRSGFMISEVISNTEL